MSAVLDYLPRGNTLSDEAWHRRHRLLVVVLAGHLPALFLFGVLRGYAPVDTAEALAAPLACLLLGLVMRGRRTASIFVTLGLVYCSAALVGLSGGAIEAHFHFFIMIGFIALYQDWVPFLLNVLFTVLSHGIGSSVVPGLMFNHAAGQNDPWTWSLIHGVAVLAACVGVVLFWRTTETEQERSLQLTKQLTAAELGYRQFTSDLLVNLARRNQNLLYRQLELINSLEDKERDPDALSDLFTLDHLATRIRRNAESLLVLSGEESPRAWRGSVPLVDVVRAAIGETEDLDRVNFAIDESMAVTGRVVADLTHLLAELLENAVHFSPPGVTVMLRSRPSLSSVGAQLVTIEDWGVGMTQVELANVNDLLRRPRAVDLSVSKRLGLHVVARLADRHGISLELTATPGGGVTAVVLLPRELFASPVSSTPMGTVERRSSPASTGTFEAVADIGAARRPGRLAGPLVQVGAPVSIDLPPDAATPGRIVEPTRESSPVIALNDAAAGPAPNGRHEVGSDWHADEALVAPSPPPSPTAMGSSRPLPEGPGPAGRAATTGAGWSDWWTPHNAGWPRSEMEGQSSRPPAMVTSGDDGRGGPAASPGGRPASSDSAAARAADAPLVLNRRTPQSHLAPGLRRDRTTAEEQPAVVADPVAASNALSRFQTFQRAGRQASVGGLDLDSTEVRTGS